MCVAVTRLLHPDLRLASAILSPLRSVVGTGLGRKTQVKAPLASWTPQLEREGGTGACVAMVWNLG